MKRKANALFKSLISLILCFSMLVGTTFAWFTDSVKSGINTIAAGNLDVELYHTNAAVTDERVNSETKLFMDLQGNPILWEPGVVSYENLRVANEGDLALAYQLAINTANENFILDPANNTQYGLSQILKVGVVEGGITATDRTGVVAAVKETDWTTLATFLRSGSLLPVDGQNQQTWGVVIYWQPGEDDNRWNLNNGKVLSEGETLQIDLGVKLVATQEVYESDAFGDNYDTEAKAFAFPNFVGGSASAAVVPNDQGQTTAAVTMDAGVVSATVPAGAQLAAGVTKLTLNVSMLGASGSNITLGEDEAMRSLDVHVDGLAENNTVPVTVTLKEAAPKGLNMGNYKVYHVEKDGTKEMTLVDASADFTAHNQFKYDPATGDVTLYMATFSEVTCVIDTLAAWNGEFDYDWYNADAEVLTIANADQLAAFGAIVGGMKKVTDRVDNKYTYSEEVIKDGFANKTVKLISDINLGDKESKNNPDLIFYPIGYNSSDGKYEKTGVAVTTGFYSFCGTFDGNGHTVANFYHNTWEMKGDHNWYDATLQYYRDGMGLFGRVYGGTIKNLTVDHFSSDGEIATTGVIAAYADGATFENIAIFNCNPRVYNIGNGGIVGCVGWYAKEADLMTTFTNITVDNSNKISALWGSYDVACGGIVGQYYPTSGQTVDGAKPVNAGIHFENCHISAQMDVYNDVCANYQYYAYRYTGMLIGSIRENAPADENGHVYPKMDGITAKDCTVHFGTWNDYYYCEFEKNGHPSYSGPDDYKFSRIPHSEINFTDSNGNGIIDTEAERASVKGCKHTHTAAEDNQCVYLEFNNLVTGYGWGVTTKVVGELDGVTILDREYANSVQKFSGIANGKEYASGTEVTIGELFEAAQIADEKLQIIGDKVMVTVSPVYGTNSTASGIYTADASDWTKGTLTFAGMGAATITIQDYYFCTPTSITVEIAGQTKFETKFTGNFLYRVGNADKSTVKLGTLFTGTNVTNGNVDVTFEKVAGNAFGTYNEDTSNWAQGTIQFHDTGVVKVIITDNDACIPTELILEVVDAVNATGTMSAGNGDNQIRNNIVLLNDCSSAGFTVADGYAFYGNGFKVTCSGKGTYLNNGGLTRGYVNVESGGMLDNVQVVCDIYPQSFVYASEVKVTSNLDTEASETGKSRYMYQLSAIALSGNGSAVTNCYAYGGRNNIYVGGGNVKIENTVTECGTLANIQIKSSSEYTVTLKDVVTEQYQTKSTYDTTKKMLGFGVLIGDNESTSNPTLRIQGSLTQYNWVTDADTNISNDYAKQAIEAALGTKVYQHTYNGKTTVNAGIIYLNDKARTIDDQRTSHGYVGNVVSVSIKDPTTGVTGTVNAYVYSLGSSSGNYETNEDDYNASAQGDVLPTINFNLGTQAVTGEDRYLKGDINGIEARYEKGQDAFALDISKLLTASKHGTKLEVTASCVDPDGNEQTGTITLSKAGTYTIKFIVKDTVFFNAAGEPVNNLVEREYTVPLALTIAEPAIADATIKVDNSSTWTGSYTNKSTDGSKNLSFNLLEGVTVTDAGSTFDLKRNGGTAEITYSATSGGYGNAFGGVTTIKVTYQDGQVLTMKIKKISGNAPGDPKTITYTVSSGEVKSSTQLAKNSCTAQEWQAYEYSFKGLNGKTITNDTIVKITVGADTSGGGCVTGDTLVTLADGTKKRVDALVGNEVLKVWDFYKGQYTVAPVGAVVNHGYDVVDEVTMRFADGTTIKTLRGHGFYDVSENKFVIIDENNVANYIGHEFVKDDANGKYTTTVLTAYSVESRYTEIWTMVSAIHFNCLLNDLWTLSPTDFEDSPAYLMPFEIGEGMKYEEAKMQADIEKYGLYTYEDFADYCTYEQFVGLNFAQWKVAVGKGYITFEDIVYLIENYV